MFKKTLAAALAIAALAAAPEPFGLASADEPDAGRLSCTHELSFEPFAGIMLTPVTIAGSPPLNFIIDSGASMSAINDPLLAQRLGLGIREGGLARGLGSGPHRFCRSLE